MTRFQKWLLWGSAGATGVTGLVYWWMQDMMEPLSEWAVINHPLQPWVLKAHILVAPVLVFALGLVTTDHIWKHFRSRVVRARRSGVITLAVLIPMIVSGYLIQGVTHESWLAALSWSHLATGVVFLLGAGAHAMAIRWSAASRRGRRWVGGRGAIPQGVESRS